MNLSKLFKKEQPNQKKYWVEQDCFRGPDGWNSIFIGRVTDSDKFITKKNRYYVDASETYSFILCDTIEGVLQLIKNNTTSSITYDMSLTEDDIEKIMKVAMISQPRQALNINGEYENHVYEL